MIVYELRAGDPNASGAEQRGRVHAHGTYEDQAIAQRKLTELRDQIENMEPRLPAGKSRNEAYWLHQIDTAEHWQLPSRPTPRQRYQQRVSVVESAPSYWNTTRLTVTEGERVVAEYDRNYTTPPFEPFRQGDRDFALVSPRYTGTSVMDLQSGEIVASEPDDSWGFCPVGFYVPDWWDLHDGSVIPGSLYWDETYEWGARGDFGFVWGCVWGDDSVAWKVQYLDLSRVAEGKIDREERFGYLYLDTHRKLKPQDFIRVLPPYRGCVEPQVEFSVPRRYSLTDGKLRSYDE